MYRIATALRLLLAVIIACIAMFFLRSHLTDMHLKDVDFMFNYNDNFQPKSHINTFPKEEADSVTGLSSSRDDVEHDLGSNFIRCHATRRPSEGDITRRDFKWQYFSEGNKTFYYQAVYYDNRDGQRDLKVFPIVGVPRGGVAMDANVNALLWYQGLDYPIETPIEQIQYQYKEHRFTNGTNYGNAFQIITLPSHTFKARYGVPKFVSFTKAHCPAVVNTYVEVVFPMPVSKAPKGILVCPKSLYGNLTDASVPLFVNWFEFLRLFGATTIHMPFSGLHIQGPRMRRVFDHYIQSGLLSHFRYSPDNLFHDDVHEVDTVAMANINDCFYRNLNQYKYVLHQDTDELFIPRRFTTYDRFVESYINETFPVGQRSQNFSCFRVYAALHYTFHPPGNPEQPDYMPVLRYTLRQPTSIWGVNTKNPGGSKTIGVMANLIKIDAHAMRPAAHARGPVRIEESQMLVHHYRGSCRRQGPTECAKEINEAFKDDLIVRNYAQYITPRVREVLEKIGYL